MNRRKVLKAFVAAPFIGVGGSAVATVRDEPLPSLAPIKAEGSAVDYDPDYLYTEDWEAKYWEAQAHIDKLYEEMQSPQVVSYTVEGLSPEDRVIGFAQPKT